MNFVLNCLSFYNCLIESDILSIFLVDKDDEVYLNFVFFYNKIYCK